MMKLSSGLNWYTYRGSYLNIRTAVFLVLLSLTSSVSGFMLLEGYSLREAVYMTVITVSTVGYGEVRPLSPTGQLFTAAIILFNFLVVAYVLAVFTSVVVEGELFKKMHNWTIQKNIRQMSKHIIVCGYGRYGREVVEHLSTHRIPFILIDRDSSKIEEIQKSERKILYIQDDATHDEALVRARIHEADALITTFPDDTDNLFTVLSARQLNPKINIISAAKEPRTEKKIRMAGADHVIMPDRLGGFYMATIISKPSAVEFFSFISNEQQSDLGFEEINYDDLPQHCHGKSIRELSIRHETGANIIGYKKKDGTFIVNPAPDIVMEPGTSYIILGTDGQLRKLREYLNS